MLLRTFDRLILQYIFFFLTYVYYNNGSESKIIYLQRYSISNITLSLHYILYKIEISVIDEFMYLFNYLFFIWFYIVIYLSSHSRFFFLSTLIYKYVIHMCVQNFNWDYRLFWPINNCPLSIDTINNKKHLLCANNNNWERHVKNHKHVFNTRTHQRGVHIKLSTADFVVFLLQTTNFPQLVRRETLPWQEVLLEGGWRDLKVS